MQSRTKARICKEAGAGKSSQLWGASLDRPAAAATAHGVPLLPIHQPAAARRLHRTGYKQLPLRPKHELPSSLDREGAGEAATAIRKLIAPRQPLIARQLGWQELQREASDKRHRRPSLDHSWRLRGRQGPQHGRVWAGRAAKAWLCR